MQMFKSVALALAGAQAVAGLHIENPVDAKTAYATVANASQALQTLEHDLTGLHNVEGALNGTMSMVADSASSSSSFFAFGKKIVKGGGCRGDDCHSQVWCPKNMLVERCMSEGDLGGHGDGTYISSDGRKCTARGGRRHKLVRAVAMCVSKKVYRKVYYTVSRRTYGRHNAWAPSCRRGDKALSCTCHSYWNKCPDANSFLPKNGRCHLRMRHNHAWGQVYTICGRKASVPKKKGGKKSPLDKIRGTLGRLDKKLESIGKNLKKIEKMR